MRLKLPLICWAKLGPSPDGRISATLSQLPPTRSPKGILYEGGALREGLIWRKSVTASGLSDRDVELYCNIAWTDWALLRLRSTRIYCRTWEGGESDIFTFSRFSKGNDRGWKDATQLNDGPDISTTLVLRLLGSLNQYTIRLLSHMQKSSPKVTK